MEKLSPIQFEMSLPKWLSNPIGPGELQHTNERLLLKAVIKVKTGIKTGDPRSHRRQIQYFVAKFSPKPQPQSGAKVLIFRVNHTTYPATHFAIQPLGQV